RGFRSSTIHRSSATSATRRIFSRRVNVGAPVQSPSCGAYLGSLLFESRRSLERGRSVRRTPTGRAVVTGTGRANVRVRLRATSVASAGDVVRVLAGVGPDALRSVLRSSVSGERV